MKKRSQQKKGGKEIIKNRYLDTRENLVKEVVSQDGSLNPSAGNVGCLTPDQASINCLNIQEIIVQD